MRDLYLVDGYNVIFWVPDVFGRDDLESSRKKLIDLLQDYGAHNNIEMIVVFDGMGTSTKVKKEVLSDSFAIVFILFLFLFSILFVVRSFFSLRDERAV